MDVKDAASDAYDHHYGREGICPMVPSIGLQNISVELLRGSVGILVQALLN